LEAGVSLPGARVWCERALGLVLVVTTAIILSLHLIYLLTFVPSTTKLRLRMSCASAIMAVTTAASIQTLISHPPPTALQVAPASNLVHDARCARFCGRRSNPPARRHDDSRPGFRLSACAITCTHPASTTTSEHARKRSFLPHSAPLSPYTIASGARRRVS
jgi:hypothetical protein